MTEIMGMRLRLAMVLQMELLELQMMVIIVLATTIMIYTEVQVIQYSSAIIYTVTVVQEATMESGCIELLHYTTESLK